MLGLDDRVTTATRINPSALDRRDLTLEYRETMTLTCDQPGVTAMIGGQSYATFPVSLERPFGSIAVQESGFYRSRERYRVTYRKQSDGEYAVVSQSFIDSEPVGPTRWIGRRVVTADVPPLTVQWVRDGQVLGELKLETPAEPFTLRSPPPGADPALLDALHRLDWNTPTTEHTVPGVAYGRRHLHWPPPPPEEKYPPIATPSDSPAP